MSLLVCGSVAHLDFNGTDEFDSQQKKKKRQNGAARWENPSLLSAIAMATEDSWTELRLQRQLSVPLCEMNRCWNVWMMLL